MAVRRPSAASETRSAVLDVAEQLVQRRGFNGFSYADVAGELGITTAAVHYHFASKSELGEALIARYTARFTEALSAIDAGGRSVPEKLSAYAGLYAEVLRHERMCLCGMLAAEYETLPDPIRLRVVRFFDDNHAWLASVLETGRDQGAVVFEGPAPEAAQLVVGALEGAMLVARSYGEPARFEALATRLLSSFVPALSGGAPPGRAAH